jgi:hypothetical protein
VRNWRPNIAGGFGCAHRSHAVCRAIIVLSK